MVGASGDAGADGEGVAHGQPPDEGEGAAASLCEELVPLLRAIAHLHQDSPRSVPRRYRGEWGGKGGGGGAGEKRRERMKRRSGWGTLGSGAGSMLSLVVLGMTSFSAQHGSKLSKQSPLACSLPALLVGLMLRIGRQLSLTLLHFGVRRGHRLPWGSRSRDGRYSVLFAPAAYERFAELSAELLLLYCGFPGGAVFPALCPLPRAAWSAPVEGHKRNSQAGDDPRGEGGGRERRLLLFTLSSGVAGDVVLGSARTRTQGAPCFP